jgi:nucleotide-binding universal stress UspA family protein
MTVAAKPYNIVVGVDYSETGDLALTQALEMGVRQGNARIHAVNVVMLMPEVAAPIPGITLPTSPGIPVGAASDALARYLDQKVGEVRERLGNAAGGKFPRVTPHLRFDFAAREIAQLAADIEADLVVVGTHGRRGMSRLLLGSVAEAVVRLAPCPVLVTRPKRIITVVPIEPPCPECVATRKVTDGEQLWCAQHSERHGQRHTYHGGDRVSQDGTMPLVFHGLRDASPSPGGR